MPSKLFMKSVLVLALVFMLLPVHAGFFEDLGNAFAGFFQAVGNFFSALFGIGQSSGGGSGSGVSGPDNGEPKCGNGQYDAGEECDGVQVQGLDCSVKGLGFTGNVSCTSECRLDFSGCFLPEGGSTSQLLGCVSGKDAVPKIKYEWGWGEEEIKSNECEADLREMDLVNGESISIDGVNDFEGQKLLLSVGTVHAGDYAIVQLLDEQDNVLAEAEADKGDVLNAILKVDGEEVIGPEIKITVLSYSPGGFSRGPYDPIAGTYGRGPYVSGGLLLSINNEEQLAYQDPPRLEEEIYEYEGKNSFAGKQVKVKFAEFLDAQSANGTDSSAEIKLYDEDNQIVLEEKIKANDYGFFHNVSLNELLTVDEKEVIEPVTVTLIDWPGTSAAQGDSVRLEGDFEQGRPAGEFIYCDSTQLSISLAKKFHDYFEGNLEKEKLQEFEVYLIKDFFNKEFVAAFVGHYTKTAGFFETPSWFLADEKGVKSAFESMVFYNDPQNDVIAFSSPGRYRVTLENLPEEGSPFVPCDAENSVNCSKPLSINFELLEQEPTGSPFYLFPLNGFVGQKEDGSIDRQTFGTGFDVSGDGTVSFSDNYSVSSSNNGEGVFETKLFFEDNLESLFGKKGVLLELSANKNSSQRSLAFSPSFAVPVNMHISYYDIFFEQLSNGSVRLQNEDNSSFEVVYSLNSEGLSSYPSSLVTWWPVVGTTPSGFDVACLELDNRARKRIDQKTETTGLYSVTQNISKETLESFGVQFAQNYIDDHLTGVIYLPSSIGSFSVGFEKVKVGNKELGEGATISLGEVPSENQRINSVQDVFDAVSKGDACIRQSEQEDRVVATVEWKEKNFLEYTSSDVCYTGSATEAGCYDEENSGPYASKCTENSLQECQYNFTTESWEWKDVFKCENGEMADCSGDNFACVPS